MKPRPLKKYGNLTREQQQLVLDHLWIVEVLVYKTLIHKQGWTGALTKEDLTQVGQFALCVAARKYDAERPIKYSTFGWTYVNGYLSHALRDRSRMVRLPRWLPKLRGEIKELKNQGKTYIEIAEDLGIPESKIFECENSYGEVHVELDITPMNEDKAIGTHAVYSPEERPFPEEALEKTLKYTDREIRQCQKYVDGDIDPTPEIIAMVYDLAGC